MRRRLLRRGCAWVMAVVLFALAFLPVIPAPLISQAATFGSGPGSQTIDDSLVAEWDAKAAAANPQLERTDLAYGLIYTQGNTGSAGIHTTRTVNSDTSTEKWKKYACHFAYCIAHSKELQTHPSASVSETAAVWYALKEPYTLSNLPPFILENAGGDVEKARFNFLIMAYAVDHDADQGSFNCDMEVGTATYLLMSVFCGHAEQAMYTGDYEHDWELYRDAVAYTAEQFHPSKLGSSRVYEEAMAGMSSAFESIYNTVQLLRYCTGTTDEYNVFNPVITQGEDGMYSASYTVSAATSGLFGAAAVTTYGDWSYELTETAMVFRSPTGELPAEGQIATLDFENANGIVRSSIGTETLLELHAPIKVNGSWSLTFAQIFLAADLNEGLKISVGSPASSETPMSGGGDITRYQHKETWQADYVVNLRKFDAETGKPLEGARFDILEAFDDSQLDGSILEDDNWANDNGSQFLRWSGWDDPYDDGNAGDPDPCDADIQVTDADGWLVEMSGSGSLSATGTRAHRDVKTYIYTKGYCGGHPAKPEPEYDEEGNLENEDEIEAWEEEVETCGALIAAGGYYCATAENGYEDGEDASGAESLQKLIQDREEHYVAFVSLTYDYSARELEAREGYIIHNKNEVHAPFEDERMDGVHADTIPIETVTVHASQYYALGTSIAALMNGSNIDSNVISGAISDVGRNDGSNVVASASNITVTMMEETTENSEDRENEAVTENTSVTMDVPTDNFLTKVVSAWETIVNLPLSAGGNANEYIYDENNLLTEDDPDEDSYWEKLEQLATASNATASNAACNAATIISNVGIAATSASNADMAMASALTAEATSSDASVKLAGAVYRLDCGSTRRNQLLTASGNAGRASGSATGIRASVSWSTSPLAAIAAADTDYYGEGCDWMFAVYDYCTEGEVHINKRDLELENGESADYDSYGDTQGDGTLEGAVYGLFAAADIIHPDGKTGVVFEQDDLVARAATDKNGDASFLAITEAPGVIYDYEKGETVATGFIGPENYYTKTYGKTSSNPNGYSYPITDNETVNGNCWIGRPLLLGSYYVRELTRSEGYELSVYGVDAEVSNRVAWEAGGDTSAKGTASVETISGSWEQSDTGGARISVTDITVSSSGTTNGYDLVISGLDTALSPEFYQATKGVTQIWSEWQETVTSYETVEAEAGTQVMIGGSSVEAELGDRIALPNGDTVEVLAAALVATTPEYLTLRGDSGAIPVYATRYLPELDDVRMGSPETFIADCNQAMETIGLAEPGEGAPWLLVPLGDMAEDWPLELYEFMESEDCPAFNAARLETIVEDNGEYAAVLRYSFLRNGTARSVLFDEATDSFLVAYDVEWPDGTAGYLYRFYPIEELVSGEDYEPGNSAYRWVRVPNVRPVTDNLAYYDDLFLVTFESAREYTSYWVYADGELLRGADGSIYQKEVSEKVTVGGYTYQESVDYQPLEAEYDNVSGRWILHIAPEQIPESGEVTVTVRYTLVDGTAGAVIQAAAVPSMNMSGSYVKAVTLSYPGQDTIREDGGTQAVPVGVQERAIKQQIKVAKDVEGVSYHALTNFRFKAYLKSNLLRLYRDEGGAVVWQDLRGGEIAGNDVGVLAETAAFPELVRKIYTRVPHQTSPLYQDSMDAVIANSELYSFTGGLINEAANSGFTALLETVSCTVEDGSSTRVVDSLNYKKFFDAIDVANHDKWDDAAPTYTSWRPIGNLANRTEHTLENARVSDAVRQFAIDWYLDEEVKKLTRSTRQNTAEKESADGVLAFADELLDEALHAAIIKTENYLTPFFTYDLDEIYAIRWDGEEDGGSDQDATTITAGTLHVSVDGAGGTQGEMGESGSYYYGLSAYLPYGTYVVAEQQPRYTGTEYGRDLGDLANKHFETDAPREVELPAVYADYAGSQTSPGEWNTYYNYNAAETQAEMERKYHIRFNEETITAPGQADSRLIYAHSDRGDYSVYPYGLDIEQIQNGASSASEGDYFALTQSRYRPYKNYYNETDDREAAKVTYYLSEGQFGREAVAEVYRYSSVSEQSGRADDVAYAGMSASTADNVLGTVYRDQVAIMHGVLTAYDGKYAPMLVPWGVAAPADEEIEKDLSVTEADGESSYIGFSYAHLRDRFYKAKLRLEKLDSETHENILHDGAVFAIYKAARDENDGSGRVLFYEEETTISGTMTFLESMGAEDIRPMARRFSFTDWLTGKYYGPGNLYTGVVPVGTPVCEEADRIVPGDGYGNQTVAFKSESTVLDGYLRNEESDTYRVWQSQSVGYLETPQPLEAGVYVIVEEKAPSGYARSAPVAVEIYSDKVSYYKEGNKDARVLAAIYTDVADNPTANANKPQDVVAAARIYVENEPIKLTVEKLKESSVQTAKTTEDKSVTYKVSGRVDGSLTQIGGNADYVYAYENGVYLGYAWKKGTLEILAARKAAGEDVTIIYEGDVFAGYGYVTRTLETADDENPYVVGATMGLFEAISLASSGDTEDYAYEGLVIERSSTGNVSRMYVREGWAGEKTEFVAEKDEDGNEYEVEYPAGVDSQGQPIMATGKIWTAAVIRRHDTDILYYDLDSLDVLTEGTVNGRTIVYGYDRNYQKIPVTVMESDQANIDRTDTDHSLFVFKGGIAYLELAGGDFTKIAYSANDKVLTVDSGTKVYHLDQDGARDALVDPYTGMAYVEQPDAEGSVLVWPVNISQDAYGNVIARDKITTSRVATIGENMDGYAENETLEVVNHSGSEIAREDRPSYEHIESGSVTGTWKAEGSGESHQETTVVTNPYGQNLNGEVLTDDNNGSFVKELNPVLDEHGLPQYYQRSEETYDKETRLYDRNGDFVRDQPSDNLEEYNNNAYRVQEHETLYDGDRPLYHRLGEGYILENVWTTSDKTPNDPFDTQETEGQADVLKRVPAGNYIMEELVVPDGYLKGLPVGICVAENAVMQQTSMVDKTIKVEILKVDGVPEADDSGSGANRSGNEADGSYAPVSGAVLALYGAERIYTADVQTYPKGYYLRQIGTEPLQYASTNSREGARELLTARWVTSEEPIYLEGIPAGDYLLKEIGTPDGFVTAEPLEVEIAAIPEVQSFILYNDHTRTEVLKYWLDDGTRTLLPGAWFALYAARTGADGSVLCDADGSPLYDTSALLDYFVTPELSVYRGFQDAFEEMYADYGTQAGTSLSWEVDGTLYHAEFVSCEQIDSSVSGGGETAFPTWAALIFMLDSGEEIRICVYGEQMDGSARDFTYEYQFDYRRLDGINAYAAGYFTQEGVYRWDYLPSETAYVLVELAAPKGFSAAEDTLITVGGTAVAHRYEIENRESRLLISKELVTAGSIYEGSEDDEENMGEDGNGEEGSTSGNSFSGELTGAKLALYEAAADGTLVQDETYLIEMWMTGEDGVYTEADYINKRIPDGYNRGDFKPHTIRELADGVYWLVELEAPPYMTAFAPRRIDYRQGEESEILRISDVPVTGELTVKKTDSGGAALTGAVYELSAYRKTDLFTPLYTRVLSGSDDTITVSGLAVGELVEQSMRPYVFKLREIVPPIGFAASAEIFTWEFAENQEGVSFDLGENSCYEITVVNEKTRVTIAKKDFEALGDDESVGAFVAGAKLAVYEVSGRDSEDELIYDADNPYAVWITKEGENEHVIEGLTAGHTYLLRELEAPSGWNIMKPMVFTLSADGRKIEMLTNNLATVTVNTIRWGDEADGKIEDDTENEVDNPDRDSIYSVTLRGRYAVSVTYELEMADGSLALHFPGTGEDFVLSGSDIPIDGSICTIREFTRYSDGSEILTAKSTKPLYADKNGDYRISTRCVSSVELAMQHADSTPIDTFTVMEDTPEHEILNNVLPENPRITVKNKNGCAGEVLDVRTAVINTVSWINPSHLTEDVTLQIRTDADTTIIDWDEENGSLADGILTYVFRDVAPLSGGTVSFATQLTGDALTTELVVKMEIGEDSIRATKTVPVLQPNKLTIYSELTGSGKDIYADEESSFIVHLYDSRNGEELKGSYAYTGSREGSLRSGDKITLAGNEFIVIDPDIYKNVQYSVEREEDGRDILSWNESGIVDREKGAGAVFTRSVVNTAEREHFRKGNSYVLSEKTTYSDGNEIESNRLQVLLGDTAAIAGLVLMDQKTRVRISKQAMGAGEELPGNEMALYDEEGVQIDAWISGTEPHEIDGELQPGCTYVLTEICPADGYAYAESIEFMVNSDGTVDEVVMIDEPTEVSVTKTNAEEKMLSGAWLQILDEQGNICEEWISGKEVHTITGTLRAGGSYILHEAEAPAGYQVADDISFIVPMEADELELTLVNLHKPTKPSDSDDSPEPSKPELRIGKITAHYETERDLGARQKFGMPKKHIAKLPRTGDDSSTGVYAGIALLAAVAMIICRRMR